LTLYDRASFALFGSASPTRAYNSMKIEGWPEKLSRGLSALLVVLLASAALPLAADTQTTSSVSRYLAARQQLDPVADLPPQALASLDPSLGGTILELRGEVVAVISPGSEASEPPSDYLLLQTDSGVTVALDYPRSDMEPTVGQRVAALAKVPENIEDRGHLQVEQIIAERYLPGASSTEKEPGAEGPSQSPSSPQIPSTEVADIPQPPPLVPLELYAPERIEIWQKWIAQHNPNLSQTQRERIVQWVLHYCHNLGVDHRLIFSVILAESNFDPNACSHAGAQGLMQLMPETARKLGVDDPFYFPENIRGGVEYLAKYLRQFRGETNYRQCALALACYNAGENAVKKYGGVPPFPETRRYIRRVTQQFYELYQAGYP